MLALQVRWLAQLQRASAAAAGAALENYLESVATEVLYFYATGAERSLNIPTSTFTQDRLESLGSYYRKMDLEGAKHLFVVRIAEGTLGPVLFFLPESSAMAPAPPSEASRAVVVACAPWVLVSGKGVEIDAPRLTVEERDPENRIILNPITDRSSRVVGVAGIVIDGAYFRSRLLPAAIRRSLPRYFQGVPLGDVAVTVRDGTGAVAFSTGVAAPEGLEAGRSLSFVFTDWRISVRGPAPASEQWARASVAFNAALLALTALVLAGGIVLTLRTASRQVALSRMKSEFLSNVSHELRTPLASIRAFGELLQMGRAASPEKAREYGDYIESESRRLTQLIENILDFSRIESGRKSYEFETGDVGAVLEDVLRSFDVRLRQAGMNVERKDPWEAPAWARIDKAAMAQVFHNLLDNALKYSGESKVISVALRKEGGGVLVTVIDRGIGIPEEEVRRIFDRFHRVSTGLVHDVRGSGLGLAIVDHVIRAHGGTVSVESEPGQGSAFTVRLPGEERQNA